MSITRKPSHISLYWIWFVVFIVLLDQGTKYLVVSSLEANRPMVILPSLELVLSYNKGISFSWLQFADDVQRWPLVSLSILASGLLVWWLSRVPSGRPILATGLTLILGGALGNMLDRALSGSVIDFVHVSCKAWSFAVSISPTQPSQRASSSLWRQHISKRPAFAQTAARNPHARRRAGDLNLAAHFRPRDINLMSA